MRKLFLLCVMAMFLTNLKVQEKETNNGFEKRYLYIRNYKL